jgi:hypothetical protein
VTHMSQINIISNTHHTLRLLLPVANAPNRFSKFFAQTWPHLKQNARGIIKACMYYFTNQISCVQYSFQNYRARTTIVTLDPNKLAEKKQQCFHIGGLKSLNAGVLLLGQSSPVMNPQMNYEKPGNPSLRVSHPPGTKAFLYYSVSPERPRISGELRLRVTSSEDPASFESGSDLLRTDGRPWLRPLHALPKYFPPLYEKLREEQLVPEDLHRVLLTFPSFTKYCQTQILYTLNDTFIVDFSNYKMFVYVVTEQGMERLLFAKTFVDYRVKYNSTPYTGAYTNHHLSISLH